MKVIAFDIDGVLTENEGIEEFREKKQEGHKVGIISSRPPNRISRFIKENNLDPDFTRSTLLKGVIMRRIKRRMEADEYIYYGSWAKDNIQTKGAGWEYRQI